MELLRELQRARALEDLLTRVVGDRARRHGGPRRISPAVPAARALHRADDGSGDVFSLRVGSPAVALTMGVDPRVVLRQALGRASAPSMGRDPGGFPTDLRIGLLAPVELPGTLVEVMAGIALSFRFRGESRVALLLDDMAGSASGDWHEGLNFAAVREVPMVLVVDHAHRGPMDGPVEQMLQRARAYGFGSHQVDGTDPRAVERVVWNAVESARSGAGLQVVDVAAPSTDPLQWLVQNLLAADVLSEDAVAGIREAADAEMRAALDEVDAEPDPDPGQALAGWGRRGWAVGAPAQTPVTP